MERPTRPSWPLLVWTTLPCQHGGGSRAGFLASRPHELIGATAPGKGGLTPSEPWGRPTPLLTPTPLILQVAGDRPGGSDCRRSALQNGLPAGVHHAPSSWGPSSLSSPKEIPVPQRPVEVLRGVGAHGSELAQAEGDPKYLGVSRHQRPDFLRMPKVWAELSALQSGAHPFVILGCRLGCGGGSPSVFGLRGTFRPPVFTDRK